MGRPDRPASSNPHGPLRNRIVLRILGSALGPLLTGLSAVRYRSASGVVVLPVQFARDRAGGVVTVARAASKRWWRHFRRAAPAELWIDGAWRAVTVHTLAGDDARSAVRRYVAEFPSARRAFGAALELPLDSRMLRVDGDLGSDALLAGSRFRRAWTVVVATAEMVGFLTPALVGVLTAAASWPVSLVLMVAAGAIEGALLGLGQVSVLRLALPTLRSGRWIALTSVAAAAAYIVGMGPSTWAASLGALPSAGKATLGAFAGVALLASIGTAQWYELRRHVREAWPWILWVGIAWLLALAVFLAIAMPLWQQGQPWWVTVTIGVGAGAAMATVQAAVTAVGMDRLLFRRGGSM